MSQINLHTTPEFECQLQKYMQLSGFRTKAEAIRAAVKESLEYHLAHTSTTNFKNWVGQATNPMPCNPRFKNEDDIWG